MPLFLFVHEFVVNFAILEEWNITLALTRLVSQ